MHGKNASDSAPKIYYNDKKKSSEWKRTKVYIDAVECFDL